MTLSDGCCANVPRSAQPQFVLLSSTCVIGATSPHENWGHRILSIDRLADPPHDSNCVVPKSAPADAKNKKLPSEIPCIREIHRAIRTQNFP
jgi:hypothetical protein